MAMARLGGGYRLGKGEALARRGEERDSSNSLERVIRVGAPSAGLHGVPMAAVNIAQPAPSYCMKRLNGGMNSGAGHMQVFAAE